jgi:signal peptidase I
MHTTTLLAHYGLTPRPRPLVRRRASTAPRRRALAVRASVRGHAPALPHWRAALAGVLIALVVGGLGVLRVWPPFAVVMSGSMAPTINTGDMVVLERLRAPARIGEIVAVNVPDDARARYGYPPVVIHRVFRITPDGQIRTKGDARPQPDPFTIPRTAVDRRVVAHIPSGGRVLAFFHSAPGLLWLLSGAVLLFGLPLLDRQRDARRQEAEAAGDLREELHTVAGELARLQAEQEQSRATADATLSQLARLVALASAGAAPTVIGTPVAAAASGEGIDRPAQTAGGPAPAALVSDDHVPATASAGATVEDPASPAPTIEILPVTDSAPAGAGDDDVPRATTVGQPCADVPPATATGAGVSVVPAAATSAAPGADVSPATPGGDLTTAAAPAASEVADQAAVVDTLAIRVRLPLLAPPTRPLDGPWDALPAGAMSGDGWAAPPSRRFQRTGRLVAATRA